MSMRRSPSRARRPHAPWIATLVAVASAGCTDVVSVPTTAEPVDLAAPWESAAPREVGLDPLRLQAVAASASNVERLRSLIVVRHGRLAYERYYNGFDARTLADVRSVTKSVVSIITGLAIAEGSIESADQPITDFLDGPDFPIRPEHSDVTIGHLLTMASGIDWTESGSLGYVEWINSGDHVRYLLERDFAAAPGTAFAYNSAAVHLLGVILEEATGRTLPAFADDVLFGPLGIDAREWEGFPNGRVNGGAGIDLRPRDLARIGQLMLQEGRSGSSQLVARDWVRRLTEPAHPQLGSVTVVGPVSYGGLWWIDVDRTAFFAWGFGGQLVYVDPDLDLVLVTTTEWRGVSNDVGSAWLTEQSMRLIVEGILAAVR